MAAGPLMTAVASTSIAAAAPSALSSSPTWALTFSILLAFPEQPIDDQGNNDEDSSGTS